VGVAQYPDDADELIRHAAGLVLNPNPLVMLDFIRDKLLGDSDKVAELALQWSGNTVIQETRTTFQTTRDVVGSYWQGSAYTQFNSYAGNLISNLDTNQTVMSNFAKTLGDCAQKVMETYGKALTLIVQTADDLFYVGALAGTLLLPGVNVITGSALLLKVFDKLNDFVKNVGNLVVETMNAIASYRSSAISFVSNATNFKVPEPLGPGTGSGIGNANQWHVAPYNK
jgi:uncharacterized protein YukE